MRVNYLAIVIATVVLFLFGYVWYDLLFGKMWYAEMAHITAPGVMTGMAGAAWYPFAVTIVTGFFSAYGLARILGWRGKVGVAEGAFIGFSMGLLLFGTMTWMDYAYSGFGMTLGWLNVGYVAVGFAIQAAILAAMPPKANT
jgi:hypothetical protein